MSQSVFWISGSEHDCHPQLLENPDPVPSPVPDLLEPTRKSGFGSGPDRYGAAKMCDHPAFTGVLDFRAVPVLSPGPVSALGHGAGPVLGRRRHRQAPMDGTVPPGPGLRDEQRQDQLVPGREAERVR